MFPRLQATVRSVDHRSRVALVGAVLLLFVGEVVLLCHAEAGLALLVAIAAAVFSLGLAFPEYGAALALIVLSLGPETLDLTRLLATLPLVARILAVVPTASITVYDLLTSVLLIAVLARYALTGRRTQRGRDDMGIWRALLLYLGVVLLTTVAASLIVPFARLDWSLLYFLRLLSSMVPYAMVVLLQPDHQWLRRYAFLYGALVFIPLIRALLQSWDPTTGTFDSYFGLYMAAGFAPMGLGTYLGSVVGLSSAALTIRTRQHQGVHRLVACVPLLASMFTIILVQKRAPIVGLAAILLVLTLLPHPDRRGRTLAGLLIGLLVVGVVAQGDVITRTFQTAIAGTPAALFGRYNLDYSLTNRFSLWLSALQAALRYPTGVGFRAMSVGPYSYPHNQYLQVLAESSILGLVCFAWLMLSILKLSLRLWRSSDRLSIVLGAGVFCGFVSMLAQGLFEESFHNWDGMALLWLLTGLAAAQLRRDQAEQAASAVDTGQGQAV